MKKISDYNLIYKNGVVRGKKDGSYENVIIKTISNRSLSHYDIKKMKHDFNIMRKLEIKGIFQCLDLIEYNSGIALIFEDLPDITLKDRLKSKPFTIMEFLKIAIKLAETVGELHRNNIIHRNIKPDNIIISDDNEVVKLVSFDISEYISGDESLSYMSPEQTGRLNKGVDYRTDMYSLGIVFYEMITSVLPFDYSDPVEIIHAHNAKIPIPPADVDEYIPIVISNIVMKLLSKMTENRYQNAAGLLYDLNECLTQFVEQNSIDIFKIGEKDIPFKFQFPNLFVGREREINILKDFIESKKDKFLLVSGRPGIGKSTLINNFYKQEITREGYLASGKFDQFSGESPYRAFIEAFQGFIHQILAEGEERVCYWNRKFIHYLGSMGRVITDVIPILSVVIGEQPDVPDLGGEESRNRFNYAVKKFIEAITTEERPLILFFDDLQWADLASIHLIETIIKDVELTNLYIIGSYRSNEVDNTHKLSRVLNRIKKFDINVNEIFLEPLNSNDVNNIISTYMQSDKETSSELSEIIDSKTGGNPFFINLFMKTLYKKGCFTFDINSGWSWNSKDILELSFTDNVIDLLILKIKDLSIIAQEVIKLCSCIGNSFDRVLISKLYSQTDETVHSCISTFIDEGLMDVKGDKLHFQHDHIQFAAYNMLTLDEKEKNHYAIANYFIEHFKDNVILIADQVNECTSLIRTSDNLYDYIEVILMAGSRVKKSGAYDSALFYFELGISLLDDRSWSKHYKLTLDLYIEAAEASYLNAEYTKFYALSKIVEQFGRSLVDKTKIYELEILVLLGENRQLEAVFFGLKILKKMGYHITSKPGVLHVLRSLITTKNKLCKRTYEELRAIPDMKDADILAAMNIMATVATSAYYSSPNVLLLIICTIINQALKFGYPPNIPFFYAIYGYSLIYIGDLKGGYKYGQLSIELLESRDDKKLESKAVFLMNLFIRHHMEHIRSTIEPLKNCRDVLFETGDIEFASHSMQVYLFHSLHTGFNLDSLITEAERCSKLTLQLNQMPPYHSITLYFAVISTLMGQSEFSNDKLMGIYNEDVIYPYLVEAGDLNNILNLHMHKLILHYLFGEYEKGILNVKVIRKYLLSGKSTLHDGLYYFYSSLVYLAQYNKIRPFILRNQKALKKMAKNAPMNYLHKYYVVEAEINRVKGRVNRAIDYYNSAADVAKEYQYIQDEAIIHELAGKFYLTLNMPDYAKKHLNRSRECYRKWGATRVLNLLEERYSDIFTDRVGSLLNKTSVNTTKELFYKSLDIETIVKTSQQISGKIELENFLKEIMKLSIEYAGAQKGCLLINNEIDKQLYIELCYDVENTELQKHSIPVNEYVDLPYSIINIVQQTREAVIINDAANDYRYMSDMYIHKNGSKSILCIPITSNDMVKGYIYLENNLIPGAFTTERVEILKVLTTQAAIAIENAAML